MKIAITVDGDDLEAPMDARFGRARKFVIYDTETGSHEFLDNTRNLNAAQGAGIQSAQNIASAGAEILITGHTGPKAFRVLEAAKIAVYHGEVGPVREVVEAFKKGELKAARAADVEGHW